MNCSVPDEDFGGINRIIAIIENTIANKQLQYLTKSGLNHSFLSIDSIHMGI